MAAAVLLVALNVAVFAPVAHYDFVQLDDPAQVSENAHVAAGLTWQGVGWAFTTAHAGYWMPIVWLSHMLDVQVYGMHAGPHHVTSLLLHMLSTLLLAGVLWRMTGAAGRSVLVAALFAVHPLHVESVAWITERKDVLSTVFWMLTLWAWVGYTRKPGLARYLAVASALALGLMAKPMLVTLPFVLLLLDVWPLGRVAAGATWRALVFEKLPLFALAAAASLVAFLTQSGAGAVSTLQAYPLGLRLENAAVSYVAYLGKTAWPSRLVPFYPYPSSWPAWFVAASLALLVAVTVLAIRERRRRPYLPVGWLWYLGTLVPVIGLVQIGLQSMADRFTYVPLVGIFIVIAWGVPDLIESGVGRSAFAPRAPADKPLSDVNPRRVVVVASACAIVFACAVAARAQLGYWKDSVTMWTRTTEVTMHTDAYHAHLALGGALRGQGRFAEAIGHFEEAVRLRPGSADARVELAEARNDLGSLLAEQGRVDESIAQFFEAARLEPDLEVAHLNLGIALTKANRIDDAVREFREVLRINPANEFASRAVQGLTAGGK